jgi:hypothetical protein
MKEYEELVLRALVYLLENITLPTDGKGKLLREIKAKLKEKG